MEIYRSPRCFDKTIKLNLFSPSTDTQTAAPWPRRPRPGGGRVRAAPLPRESTRELRSLLLTSISWIPVPPDPAASPSPPQGARAERGEGSRSPWGHPGWGQPTTPTVGERGHSASWDAGGVPGPETHTARSPPSGPARSWCLLSGRCRGYESVATPGGPLPTPG